MRINNPKRLGTWSLPAERITIGPGYKPNMAQLKNGELVMMAEFAEQHEGQLREWTGMWRSRDGGLTWSARERVEDLIGREHYLTCLRDGTLFVTCHLLKQDYNNRNGVTHSYIHKSIDGGRSWKRTRLLGNEFKKTDNAMCSRNVVELSDGSLLLGVGMSGRPGRVAYVWTSTDKGETWQSSPLVKLGRYQGKPYDNWDCFFCEDFTYETKEGKLLHWIRCGPPSPMHAMNDGRPVPTGDGSIDRTMLCESTDGGLTWSDLRDFGEYARHYPRVLRLQDGRLLMTYTKRGLIYPIGLCAQVSYDDGETWDFDYDQIVIEGRTSWGMPQGGGFGNTVQLPDGSLVSSSSYNRADSEFVVESPQELVQRGVGGEFTIEVVRWRLPDH